MGPSRLSHAHEDQALRVYQASPTSMDTDSDVSDGNTSDDLIAAEGTVEVDDDEQFAYEDGDFGGYNEEDELSDSDEAELHAQRAYSASNAYLSSRVTYK